MWLHILQHNLGISLLTHVTLSLSPAQPHPLIHARRWRPATVAVEMWNTLGRSATGHHAEAWDTPMCLTLCQSTFSASCVHGFYTQPTSPIQIMTLKNTVNMTENLIFHILLNLFVKHLAMHTKAVRVQWYVYNHQTSMYKEYVSNNTEPACGLT